MQGEELGRSNSQDGGSGSCGVVVWTAESRDDEDRPVRDPGSVSDTAAIESAASRDTDPDPSKFARRMRREAERRGFTLARRRVILGDGASWIWRSASEDYPGAIQIVDLWHAKEQLWEVARVLFAHDKLLVEPWADARCDDLEQGRLDGLLATLRAHAGTCEQAGKCANYIEKNRSRMRYPEFRAQGLCVGSGVVESGCRTVVGRLKRSGMYWTVSGANAIPALEAHRDRLLQLIAGLGDMCPGTLSNRDRPCGKPHGPDWSLTFKSDGETGSRSLRPDQVATARQQITNFRRYQALSAELVEVSAQLCQARLAQNATAAAQQAKKKGITYVTAPEQD